MRYGENPSPYGALHDFGISISKTGDKEMDVTIHPIEGYTTKDMVVTFDFSDWSVEKGKFKILEPVPVVLNHTATICVPFMRDDVLIGWASPKYEDGLTFVNSTIMPTEVVEAALGASTVYVADFDFSGDIPEFVTPIKTVRMRAERSDTRPFDIVGIDYDKKEIRIGNIFFMRGPILVFNYWASEKLDYSDIELNPGDRLYISLKIDTTMVHDVSHDYSVELVGSSVIYDVISPSLENLDQYYYLPLYSLEPTIIDDGDGSKIVNFRVALDMRSTPQLGIML